MTKSPLPDRLPPSLRKPIVPHVPRFKLPTTSSAEAKRVVRQKLLERVREGDPVVGRLWVADTHLGYHEGFFRWTWISVEDRFGWEWAPPRFFLKLWTPDSAPPEEHFENFALTPDDTLSDMNLPWHVSLEGETVAQLLNLRLMRCGYRVYLGLEKWKDDNNTYLNCLQSGTLGPIFLRLESMGHFSSLPHYHISF